MLPKWQYYHRIVRYLGLSVGFLTIGLLIGIVGYRYIVGISWIDAFLNASMLLGGMGPVNTPATNAGKIFAGCYALFSGIIFLIAAGIIFAPIFHRFLHHFHLDVADADTSKNEGA